ncbi:MAG: hypothetical protein ABJE00_06605, partial [Erythrobacter sp.]
PSYKPCRGRLMRRTRGPRQTRLTTTGNPSLAIGLPILSDVLFAGMLVCVKAVGTDAPLGEIVFVARHSH